MVAGPCPIAAIDIRIIKKQAISAFLQELKFDSFLKSLLSGILIVINDI
jgi:hypothetical protein